MNKFYSDNEDLCGDIQAMWLNFINGETDPDKLQELADEYMELLKGCITDDHGQLVK